jgi:hypothetical protein
MVLNPQDKTVSQEAPAGPLTGTELVRIVQGGASVRATAQQIAALAASTGGGSITRAQIPTVTVAANTIVTTGYATDGDLGAGAIYTKFVGTPPVSETLAIQDASGQWFNIVVPEGRINVGWFGAINDGQNVTGGGTDNHDAFQHAIDYCTNSHPLPPGFPPGSEVILYEMFVPSGSYRIGSTLTVATNDAGRGHIFWTGEGGDFGFYKRTVLIFDHASPYCITIASQTSAANHSIIRHLGFAAINQSVLQHCFNLQSGQHFVDGIMEDLQFYNFTGYCIFFTNNNAYAQCATFKDIFMSIVGGFIGADVALITGSISGTVLTVTAVENGTIRPQTAIAGSGLLRASAIDGTAINSNTFVLNQLTGTPGGVGTYTVSVSQTSPLQPMRQNAMFSGGNVFIFHNIDLENGVNQAFRQYAFFDFINMTDITMHQVIYEGGASTNVIFRLGGGRFKLDSFYIEQSNSPTADYFFEVIDSDSTVYPEVHNCTWENAANINTIFFNRCRGIDFLLHQAVPAAAHPVLETDVNWGTTGPGITSVGWNRVIQENSGKFLTFNSNLISRFGVREIKHAANSGPPRGRLFTSVIDDVLYEKHGAWLDGDRGGKLIALSAVGATSIGMFTDATEGRVFEILAPANTLPDFRIVINVPTELATFQMSVAMRYYFAISVATTTPTPIPLLPNIASNYYDGTAIYTLADVPLNAWANAFMVLMPQTAGAAAARIDSQLSGLSPAVTDATPKLRIASLYVGLGASVPYMLGGAAADQPVTWYATAAPTYGVYIVGDRVINSAPTAGQPTGWVCTTAGTIGSGCVFTPDDALQSLRTTANSIVTTGTYTVVDADDTVTFNAVGTCTVTLPAPASYVGRWLHFLTIAAQTVISASSNVVALTGGAAGTPILAATSGKWAALQSDGTNWRIMQGN